MQNESFMVKDIGRRIESVLATDDISGETSFTRGIFVGLYDCLTSAIIHQCYVEGII